VTPEAGIKSRLKQDLKPCRALAPEGVYAALFTLLALVPMLWLLLRGARGWQHRTELGLVPLVLSIAAAPLLGRTLARLMVPGSGRTHAGWLFAIWFPLAALAIYSSASMEPGFQFGAHERHCFLAGVKFALPIAALAFLIVVRGAVLRSLETGAIAGLLAGLAGFAVLETSCGITGKGHLLSSHYTVPIALALFALALSPLLRRRISG